LVSKIVSKISNPYQQRPAIAMVELIFSITIMGIVMLSAPLLIDRSSQSTYVALQQESIAAAATQINMIMATEWDSADTNSSLGAPVLQTGSTAIANCTTDKPVGVTSASGRYCKDALATNSIFLSATSPASLGTESNYQTSTTFSNPFRHIVTANSTNIKLIQVSLSSNNSANEIQDKQIVLTAFMCNIGAPKPKFYSNRP